MLGTRLLKYLQELEETQWWSPEQLEELQNEKLRALIKHAYENVPYYHRIFEESGLAAKDIQTVDDLSKLPILTNNDIRENFQDLMAKDFNKWKPFLAATSGSTGKPLKYYVTMDVASVNWAGVFRAWGWAGYKVGDKRATLGGSSLVPNKPPKFIERVRRLGERNLCLSAFDMSEQRMALYVNKLQRYKPRFIYGYASAIYFLASYLKEKGINDIQPKAIFTTAEMLLPNYREKIEQQFACKIFDQYGSYDGGAQASECPTHNGYHISSEKVMMEFVDEDKKPVIPGYPGEIVVTDLHNYAMPFIRYAVGDRGIYLKEQCICGRGLPLMKSIEGRISDLIITPEGKNIHGEFFSHIFWQMTCFKQFQVVQESLDKLIIKVIPYPAVEQSKLYEEVQMISEIVHMRTGIMKITIEQVDNIPTTEAGKQKFIVTKVSQ